MRKARSRKGETFLCIQKEPYAEDDVIALISLVNKMWEMLRRKHVEESLRKSED